MNNIRVQTATLCYFHALKSIKITESSYGGMNKILNVLLLIELNDQSTKRFINITPDKYFL